MDIARKTFPNGLPTLEQLAAYNKGKDVIPETSWIWGKDDEVCNQGSFSDPAVRCAHCLPRLAGSTS